MAPAPQGAVPVQAPTPPGGAVDEAVQEKARMVDEKLWEGAAAAGWQLHQSRSGYIYTAPNGTRYTSKKEAKLHLKQPTPLPRVQWMAGAKGSTRGPSYQHPAAAAAATAAAAVVLGFRRSRAAGRQMHLNPVPMLPKHNPYAPNPHPSHSFLAPTR